jgi:hypothetical protein
MAASEEKPIKSTFTPPAWLLQKAKENAARLGYDSDALSKELRGIRANPEEAAKKAKEHATKMGVDATAVRMIMAAQNPRPFMKMEDLSLDGRRSASAEAEVLPSHEADIQMELDGMSTSEQASPPPRLDRRTASAEQEPILSSEVDVQASIERSVMQQATSAPKSRSASSSASESDQPREVVMQPTVSAPAPPISGSPISKQQKLSVKSSPSKRRDVQVEKRDDRRAKKEVARVKQAKALIKKSVSKSLSPTTESPAVSTSAFAAVQKAVRTKALSKSASKSASPATDSPTIAETPDAMDIDRSPSLFVAREDPYPVPTALPKWCTNIKDTGFNMLRLAKKRPQSLASLESLKNCIGRCEVEMKRAKLHALYEELRDHVHKAEFLNEDLHLMPFVLKKARILSPENGLPRIFKDDADFPSDLKADSYWLYNRWCKEDFAQDILRGIVTVKGKDRNGDRLDTAYRARFLADAKVYGANGLVLGQWWPTQLCTVRDGAHGAAQGGIFGNKEKGAYSIVLSGGGYHDNDDGDVIEYSGTEGKNFTPTDNTLSMIRSAELKNEIRVIRSSQLLKKNPYRPQVGLRYDGLYKIEGVPEPIDKKKQTYRFTLHRSPGQDAIRCGDNAARRPTIYEIREYERNKEKWV